MNLLMKKKPAIGEEIRKYTTRRGKCKRRKGEVDAEEKEAMHEITKLAHKNMTEDLPKYF